jgi:hypothetical protein
VIPHFQDNKETEIRQSYPTPLCEHQTNPLIDGLSENNLRLNPKLYAWIRSKTTTP